MDTIRYTFKKNERLCRESHVKKLFTGRNDYSDKLFPFRISINFVPAENVPCSKFLPVVPKRNIKKAVHRNRKKRLMKEAWRLSKHLLLPILNETKTDAHIALFYNSKEPITFVEVQEKLNILLEQLLKNYKPTTESI
ncbi:MAG: ribonuclease P protein component [Bacteroidota bacterium]|nr:ribonuclease P protein component [Bacteroidota bacterium]